MVWSSTIGKNGAGIYRHPISVTLTTTLSEGARGQPATTSTATIGTGWAAIEPLTGRRLEIAREIVDGVSHQITMRYMPSVTSKCLVVFGTRTFNIGHVLN